MAEKTLTGFMEELSSSSPTPGGGSVSALAGVLGASLLEMVCNLTIGKEKYKEYEADLMKTREEIQSLKTKLFSLIEEDAKAFDGVMAGFKMPKGTDEEKKARSAAIQNATKEATRIPLETAKSCLRLLELCKDSVRMVNPNAISDLGVCTLMSHSGLEGASLNVLINTPSIKDQSFKEDSEKTLKELRVKGEELKSQLMPEVEKLTQG
jgi:formiminotetrahydrofolate cyclodeaminase